MAGVAVRKLLLPPRGPEAGLAGRAIRVLRLQQAPTFIRACVWLLLQPEEEHFPPPSATRSNKGVIV